MTGVSAALGVVERTLSIISAVLVLFLMLLITSEVALRWIFNYGFEGVFEGSNLLLVIIVFFGVADTLASGGHIRVELFTNRVHGRMRTALEYLAYSLGLLTCSVIAWKSGDLAVRAIVMGDYAGGLIQFPLWPSKIAIPIGMGLMALRFLVEMINLTLRRGTLTRLESNHVSATAIKETDF